MRAEPASGYMPRAHGVRDRAHPRGLRTRGRQTARRLLSAGRAEFAERGFWGASVDGIAHRAGISHGTFSLYFDSKDDLFAVLAGQALTAMDQLAGSFPVVTSDPLGRADLRDWMGMFQATYAAHSAVIRPLSQADAFREDIWNSSLRVLFHLGEAMSSGMAALAGRAPGSAPCPGVSTHLTGLACLIMLERVTFLMEAGIGLPGQEMTDRLTAIMLAAFRPLPEASGQPARPGYSQPSGTRSRV